MQDPSPPPNETGRILLYQNEKGDTKLDVYFAGETLWMTQRALGELYGVDVRTINEHIGNILADGELDDRTIRKFRMVQTEGTRQVSREVKHYSFEMVLAVGYRVRSRGGVHFRTWATNVLAEYSRKGFAINDERLADPKPFGADYFEELLARIRDIRASEKRFYAKICDIYKTAVDYDPKDEETKRFFSTVQNKLHYSVHGHTAAELIVQRADAKKPNMGLTHYKGAKVRRGDVSVAKNYLREDELQEFDRIVSMYLDYAEDQARRQNPMTMADWEEKLGAFLRFNGRELLESAGSVAAELAKETAEREYERFEETRRLQEAELALLEEEAARLPFNNKD